MKNFLNNKFVKNQYLPFLQLILSIVLIVMICIQLPVLPVKYLIIVILALIFLFAVVYITQFNSDFFSLRGIISKIISMIVCMGLIFGCFLIQTASSFVGGFTGVNIQTDAVSLIVLEESPYQELNDLEGKNIEYNQMIDTDNTNNAIADIAGQIDITFTAKNSWYEIYNGLFNNECDAILLNEAYRVLLENIDESFSEKTRVIYQVSIENRTENIANVGSVNDGKFNILISGIDTYGDVSTRSRSDVNMIMTVDMIDHQVLLTGIPRDTYVPLAMNGQYDKLTHTGIYGINETVMTLEGFLDIEIDYYFRVNFTSLIEVVDVLGGIEVYSDQTLNLNGYTINEGMNHMDGEMALAFARERYSYASGDYHRIQNQQEVMIGIINKMISADTLKNYQSILNKVDGSFDTNMSKNDLITVVRNQINNMQGYAIERQYLSGSGQRMTGLYSMPNSSLYALIPDETSKQAISTKIKEICQ